MDKAKATTPPFAGLRVVEVAGMAAAPSATQYLGMLGADVIKVGRNAELLLDG